MTRRQDNPILLWLIASTDHERRSNDNADDWWGGYWAALADMAEVCRWLDAEDEWVDTLPPDGEIPSVTAWRAWNQARMAEAGVL